MTWPDRIILLATGLVAAYLIWFFGKRYSVGRKVRALYFLASFTVLLVAGLLLILFSYDALAKPSRSRASPGPQGWRPPCLRSSTLWPDC